MMMSPFLSGATMLACWAIGLFFARFHQETGERLFSSFAVAFWLLAVERLALLMTEIDDETRGFLFVIRLIAFVVILYAILEKNRASRGVGQRQRARASGLP